MSCHSHKEKVMSAKPARKPTAYRYVGSNSAGYVDAKDIVVTFEGYTFEERLDRLSRTDLRATASFIGSSGAAGLTNEQILTGICMKVKTALLKQSGVNVPTTTVVEPTVSAPTPTISVANGKGSLEEIVEGIARSTTLHVLEDFKPEPSMTVDQITNLVASKVAEIVSTPKVSNIVVNGVPVVSNSKEFRHKQYQQVLRHIMAEDTLYLWGGAGAGKTHVISQVARDLGRHFHFEECHSQSTVAKLFGFRDATGSVQLTALIEALTKPSIILIDEFDVTPPSVAVALNALSANRMCSSPQGIVEMHPDCVLVFSGNTNLDGATGAYNGRQSADFSTKDRLSIVEFVIDEEMEDDITKDILGDVALATTWLKIVRAARTNVLAMGTSGDRIRVTPRASYGGAKLLRNGFTIMETAEARLRKGIDQRTWDQVRAGIVEIGG
jgi:hypothetical protein